MDEYRIHHPYIGKKLSDGSLELEIVSENLIYGEIGFGVGCQCKNMDKQKEILDKCKQVANLIREIDKLNNE